MRRPLLVGALLPLVVTVGVTAVLLATPLADGPWKDGSRHGRWTIVFTGYGKVRGDDTSMELAPKAVGADRHTHAALVVTNETYADLALTASLKTHTQLRDHRPNAWEVGWVLWQYRDPQRFYAVALKPSGWEVSKQDPAYPRGQRFLASGTSPAFPVGRWHTVSVVQVGNRIKVSADGRLLTSFTDDEDPYLSGAVGLYCEDARVSFKDVQALGLPSEQ